MNDRKTHGVDVTKINKGDLMTFTYWVTVKDKLKQNNVEILRVIDVNDQLAVFEIRGKELVESGTSADQFHENQKITKTAAAQLLIESHNKPFTVSFMKQDGQERVLRGRLVKHEALLGRSMVEDLDSTDKKNRMRQVDHRTLNWIVVDGMRYEIK